MVVSCVFRGWSSHLSPTPICSFTCGAHGVCQFWEENQDMYLLCAGYEATLPAKGVCIELSVTGVVTPEDDGDGTKAGTRVAGKVRTRKGFPSWETWI